MNNSGVTWGESIESYPDAAFTKLLTLNVQRVFTLTQKLLPMLKKGGHPGAPGRVINVGPAVSWLLGFRVYVIIDRIDQWDARAWIGDVCVLCVKSRSSPVRRASLHLILLPPPHL